MSANPDNPYLKRYRSLSIHEDMRIAAERIVAAKTDGMDSDYLFKHARVGRGIAHIRSLLDSVDPELMNLAQIDNMVGLANNLRVHCEAYANTSNAGSLDSADGALNEVYNYIRFLPLVPPERAVAAANDAARDFTKSAIGFLDEVLKKNKSLTETIEAQGQRLQEQQSKIDETNRTIETQKARLDQAIATHQATFSQNETDRAKQFIEQTTAWEKSRLEIDSLQKQNVIRRDTELIENNKIFLEEFQKRAAAVMQEMNRLESDTKRIFGVVGNTTQSGEYRNAANHDAAAANWLRFVALLLMGAMIVVGYLAFKHSLDHPEVDWKLFGFRLGTTIILAIPAVYAAQESAKHRQREQSNRRIHLELAAIDAYLELLPEAKRQEIKASLAEKFFGREEKIFDTGSKETSHAILKLLEEVVKNATKPQK